MYTCHNCGTVMLDSATRCPKCGPQRSLVFCYNCGNDMPDATAFCPHCHLMRYDVVHKRVYWNWEACEIVSDVVTHSGSWVPFSDRGPLCKWRVLIDGPEHGGTYIYDSEPTFRGHTAIVARERDKIDKLDFLIATLETEGWECYAGGIVWHNYHFRRRYRG